MKRIVFLLLFLIVFFSPLLGINKTTVFAAAFPNNWVGTYNGTDYDKAVLEGDMSGKPHIRDNYISTQISMVCGVVPVPGEHMCTNDPGVYKAMLDQSALANISNLVVAMYANPAANTYAFVRDAGESLGFIPKSAYAADGTGYQGLLPLLPIWKGFRNIAYGLLAVAMIAIGFMIMFRKKIDPKTVMTVQSSLPRIVVTLLLITFSYAIAGFLIDLMYVVMLIGIELLKNSGLKGVTVTTLAQDYMNGGVIALFGGVFEPMFKMLGLTLDFTQWPTGITKALTSELGSTMLNAVKAIGWTLTGIGPMFWTVLAIAFLFAFVRIFFMLLSAYVQILFDVIIAPLQILLDVFPGSNQAETWLKHLLSNLMTFPITVFLLILGGAISSSMSGGQLWEPPLLPHTSMTGDGGFSNSLGSGLLWLGIIFGIPSVVASLKEAIKAKAAMSAGLGTVLGPIGSGVGQVMHLGYQASMIGGMFGGHARKPDTTATEGLRAAAEGK